MPDYIMDAAHRPQVIRRPGADGELIVERIPATSPNKAKLKRWVHMLDANGNDKRVPLTTGASNINPRGKYAERKMAMMMAKGWFPFGKCPLALVAVGELKPGWIPDDILEQTPCPPGRHNNLNPCPHTRAIKDLRLARQKRVTHKRETAYKSKEAHLLEQHQAHQTDAMSQLAATQQQQTEVITRLVEAHVGKHAPTPGPPDDDTPTPPDDDSAAQAALEAEMLAEQTDDDRKQAAKVAKAAKKAKGK